MNKHIRTMVITLAVSLLAGLGVILLMPTATLYSHDAGFAKERLRADLSVSNQVEFLSGRFQRESVVVYRLLNESFAVDKFCRIRAEHVRNDCIEMVSERMKSCGLSFSPNRNDEFFTFYGADYSVVYVKSKPDSYLIYLTAQ